MICDDFLFPLQSNHRYDTVFLSLYGVAYSSLFETLNCFTLFHFHLFVLLICYKQPIGYSIARNGYRVFCVHKTYMSQYVITKTPKHNHFLHLYQSDNNNTRAYGSLLHIFFLSYFGYIYFPLIVISLWLDKTKLGISDRMKKHFWKQITPS